MSLMPERVGWWRTEPYRVFFPLGWLIAWSGIGHWLLLALSIDGSYRNIFHAMAQVQGFLTCFDALAAAYLVGVGWEAPAVVESRAASLLPGLFLAREDGKSPVEYLTREGRRQLVRRLCRELFDRRPGDWPAARELIAAGFASSAG